MPLYEFVNEDGVKEEHWMAFWEAVPIGTQRVIDGRLLTRLPPSTFQTSVSGDRHFVGYSQPLCNPDGSVPDDVVPAPRYDLNPNSPTYRKPLFSGKAEVDAYCADSDGRVVYGK